VAQIPPEARKTQGQRPVERQAQHQARAAAAVRPRAVVATTTTKAGTRCPIAIYRLGPRPVNRPFHRHARNKSVTGGPRPPLAQARGMDAPPTLPTRATRRCETVSHRMHRMPALWKFKLGFLSGPKNLHRSYFPDSLEARADHLQRWSIQPPAELPWRIHQ
jgi:hypothetical protein